MFMRGCAMGVYQGVGALLLGFVYGRVFPSFPPLLSLICPAQHTRACSITSPRTTSPPFFLCTHPSQNCAHKEAISQNLGLEDADSNRDIDIFSCSLVNNVGYVEGFRWLSARL